MFDAETRFVVPACQVLAASPVGGGGAADQRPRKLCRLRPRLRPLCSIRL